MKLSKIFILISTVKSDFADGTIFKFTPPEKIRENVPEQWQKIALKEQGE